MPTTCPDCGGSVEVSHVASQYQEEIPEVRRFDIDVGHCSPCQRRVQGRHALQRFQDEDRYGRSKKALPVVPLEV